MIKWIQNYLQNKSDARKHMMVPTRKPSVKINLKKIRFKRGEVQQSTPFQDKSIDHNRKNLEFKTNSIPVGNRKDNEGVSVIDNQKIYRANSGGYMTLLIIALTFLAIVLGYVFFTDRASQVADYRADCNSLFSQAIQEGLDMGGVNCVKSSGFLDQLNLAKIEKSYSLVEQKVNTQRSELQRLQTDLDRGIAETTEYLTYFEVSDIPSLPAPTPDVNNAITDKQEYLFTLQKLLETEVGDMDTTLSRYNFLLQINPLLDLTDAKSYYNTFISQEQGEQYRMYNELVSQYASLIETISKEQDNQFVPDLVSQDEFFKFKFFSGEEFKQVWYRTLKPETQTLEEVVITNDNSADRRIIQIAVDRGYQLQVEADASRLVSIENELLDAVVVEAYEQMRQAALVDGVELGLVSGYRSPDTQRDIFLSRFNNASVAEQGNPFDVQAIAAGEADIVIDSVLQTSSIPGYSKHHTGLAIDLVDLSSNLDFVQFKNTQAFQWLKAGNYYNAKRFGFVPSYPEDATKQGPNPEAWEYVYVGVDALK